MGGNCPGRDWLKNNSRQRIRSADPRRHGSEGNSISAHYPHFISYHVFLLYARYFFKKTTKRCVYKGRFPENCVKSNLSPSLFGSGERPDDENSPFQTKGEFRDRVKRGNQKDSEGIGTNGVQISGAFISGAFKVTPPARSGIPPAWR